MKKLRRLFSSGKSSNPSFVGFRHPSGIGVRSNNYAIPLSRPASGFTRALSADANLTLIENSALSNEGEQVAYLAHTFLPQLARQRNTAGIFIIAVGDEPVGAAEIASKIQSLGTACEYLVLNDCPDMDSAINLALATAQELKNMALSGLDRIDPTELTITFHEEPSGYLDLLTLFQGQGFTVHSEKVQGPRSQYLADSAMEGAHVILSFLAENEYPTGSLVTPVINVASTSNFHRSIANECDLRADSTPQEIVEKVSMAFGMVPTHTEAIGIYEPLFSTNLPSLKDEDGFDEICLIPAHPALNSFLIDLASHQTGFFLRDWSNLSLHSLQARKILVIGTGGREDHFESETLEDLRAQKITVSEVGSLRELAQTILSHA